MKISVLCLTFANILFMLLSTCFISKEYIKSFDERFIKIKEDNALTRAYTYACYEDLHKHMTHLQECIQHEKSFGDQYAAKSFQEQYLAFQKEYCQ